MNGQGTLRIVSAGALPVTEYVGRPDLLGDFSIDGLKTPLTNSVAEDLAIRLAANDLVTAAKKRAIVIINAGDKNDIFFRQYNLAELTAYMNNNSIACSIVQMSQNALPEELSYIVDNTTGKEYYVYRPQGLSQVLKDILETPQGIYQLSYTSALQKNYGLSYLPLEAEVYLLNKSGRDETGYFAPLE